MARAVTLPRAILFPFSDARLAGLFSHSFFAQFMSLFLSRARASFRFRDLRERRRKETRGRSTGNVHTDRTNTRKRRIDETIPRRSGSTTLSYSLERFFTAAETPEKRNNIRRREREREIRVVDSNANLIFILILSRTSQSETILFRKRVLRQKYFTRAIRGSEELVP